MRVVRHIPSQKAPLCPQHPVWVYFEKRYGLFEAPQQHLVERLLNSIIFQIPEVTTFVCSAYKAKLKHEK